MRKLLLTALVLLCSVPIVAPADRLKFSTISKSPYSNISEKSYRVITSKEDWEALWNQIWVNTDPKPPLPEVDFSRRMIIAAFQGLQRSGGHSISVSKLVNSREALKVTIVERSPGPGCAVTGSLTHPQHIIETERVDKEVVFKVKQRLSEC